MTASMTETHCYPWCAWKDDHSPDDACFASEHHVDLTSYPEIEDHIYADGCRPGVDQLKVCGYAETPSATPRVAISHNVQHALGYFQVELSLAEARGLIAAVQSALDEIGRGR